MHMRAFVCVCDFWGMFHVCGCECVLCGCGRVARAELGFSCSLFSHCFTNMNSTTTTMTKRLIWAPLAIWTSRRWASVSCPVSVAFAR